MSAVRSEANACDFRQLGVSTMPPDRPTLPVCDACHACGATLRRTRGGGVDVFRPAEKSQLVQGATKNFAVFKALPLRTVRASCGRKKRIG